MTSLQPSTPSKSAQYSSSSRRKSKVLEKKRLERMKQIFSGGFVNHVDNLLETNSNYRKRKNDRSISQIEGRELTSSDDEDDDDILDQTNDNENSLPYSYHFHKPDRPLTEAEKKKQEMLANWSPEISEEESEDSLEQNIDHQIATKTQPKTPELSKNLANLSVIDRNSQDSDSSSKENKKPSISGRFLKSSQNSQNSLFLSSTPHVAVRSPLKTRNYSKNSSAVTNKINTQPKILPKQTSRKRDQDLKNCRNPPKRQKTEESERPSDDLQLSDLSDLEFTEEAEQFLDNDLIQTQKQLELDKNSKDIQNVNFRQRNEESGICSGPRSCNLSKRSGSRKSLNVVNENLLTEQFSLLDDDFDAVDWE